MHALLLLPLLLQGAATATAAETSMTTHAVYGVDGVQMMKTKNLPIHLEGEALSMGKRKYFYRTDKQKYIHAAGLVNIQALLRLQQQQFHQCLQHQVQQELQQELQPVDRNSSKREAARAAAAKATAARAAKK